MSNNSTTATYSPFLDISCLKDVATSAFEQQVQRVNPHFCQQLYIAGAHQYFKHSDTTAFFKPRTDESLKKQRNLQTVNSFSLLEEGWDKDGAPAFSPNVIERAKSLLQFLHTQPEVFPTLRGSIQFEYEVGGRYLEFEIFEDKTTYYLEGPDDELSGELQVLNNAETLISKLYA